MQDFEDSEKEAKEWYDKVLKQITSRRDEHLESGLGFGGTGEKSNESSDLACPYLPPKEDRVEMVKAEAPAAKRASCSREYPQSRFFDWVWTGWGGPSTSSEMLFRHEKADEEQSQNTCHRRRNQCKGRWARGQQENTVTPALPPVPEPDMEYLDKMNEKYSEEAWRTAFQKDGTRGVTKLLEEGIRDLANGQIVPQPDFDENRDDMKKVRRALDDAVAKTEPVIKRWQETYSPLELFRQMTESSGSPTGAFPQGTYDNEEVTELDVFEQLEKQLGFKPAEDIPNTQSQLDRARKIQSSRVLSSLKQSENSFHADGTSTLTETIKETLSDGQTTTRRIVKNLDSNGNLISQSEESKTQDSQASAHYYPYSRPAPVASKPTTTTGEVSKMLQERKQEQKSGSSGWFWKS